MGQQLVVQVLRVLAGASGLVGEVAQLLFDPGVEAGQVEAVHPHLVHEQGGDPHRGGGGNPEAGASVEATLLIVTVLVLAQEGDDGLALADDLADEVVAGDAVVLDQAVDDLLVVGVEAEPGDLDLEQAGDPRPGVADAGGDLAHGGAVAGEEGDVAPAAVVVVPQAAFGLGLSLGLAGRIGIGELAELVPWPGSGLIHQGGQVVALAEDGHQRGLGGVVGVDALAVGVDIAPGDEGELGDGGLAVAGVLGPEDDGHP